MLFNKNDNGSQELHDLTGSYYANNNFSRISGEIELAKEEVTKIIGNAIMEKVEDAYATPSSDKAVYVSLVPYVQLPVAILATLSMYQKNDVSHENDGRKIKISTETEKLPWEWQLKRDDEIQLNQFYKAVDRLIGKLDSLNPTEWKDSESKKAAKSLLIANTEQFDNCFPIERSGRMFMLLLPFLKEVQRRIIKPALGSDFPTLLSGTGLTDKQKELIEYVRPPMALFAMALAIRRLPIGLIPSGVVRNYVSSSGTMTSSQPASVSDVKALAGWMEDDARQLLDEMKRFRTDAIAETSLLPENSIDNKFFRV